MENSFCGHLEQLNDWKRRKLPILSMPQGAEVVAWLMSRPSMARSLTELYTASRFSEPTVRNVIQSLADRDLVVFLGDDGDQRRRLVRASPKLTSMLEEYVSQITQIASSVHSEALDDALTDGIPSTTR